MSRSKAVTLAFLSSFGIMQPAQSFELPFAYIQNFGFNSGTSVKTYVLDGSVAVLEETGNLGTSIGEYSLKVGLGNEPYVSLGAHGQGGFTGDIVLNYWFAVIDSTTRPIDVFPTLSLRAEYFEDDLQLGFEDGLVGAGIGGDLSGSFPGLLIRPRFDGNGTNERFHRFETPLKLSTNQAYKVTVGATFSQISSSRYLISSAFRSVKFDIDPNSGLSSENFIFSKGVNVASAVPEVNSWLMLLFGLLLLAFIRKQTISS